MFGFSIGEVVVLVVVAIILIGPRQLPSMLRNAGQWLTKLRRMAFDMRSQSGIDQLLKDEGLERDLKELRRLLALRRGNVLDALTVDLDGEGDTAGPPKTKTRRAKGSSSQDDMVTLLNEYPLQGCDAYGAVPEDVAPYMEAARSPELPPVDFDPYAEADQSPARPSEDPHPDTEAAEAPSALSEASVDSAPDAGTASRAAPAQVPASAAAEVREDAPEPGKVGPERTSTREAPSAARRAE